MVGKFLNEATQESTAASRLGLSTLVRVSGASWNSLGASFCLLEAPWGILGASWVVLSALRSLLGCLLGTIGSVLVHLRARKSKPQRAASVPSY